MRLAPPVQVRCSGGRRWRALLAGLPALATASMVAWGLALADAPIWPAMLAGPAMALLLWTRRAPKACTLEWSGSGWALDGTPSGAVAVMVDLGRWLLLRVEGSGRPHWLALTAAEAGPALHLLRAALYAPGAVAR